MSEYWTRSVADSAILGWWNGFDRESSAQRQSVVLDRFASCPRWAAWLLLFGIGPVLVSIGAPLITIVGVMGVACASFLFVESATVLLLPTLVWSLKFPLESWASESVYVGLDHAIVFGILLHVVANRKMDEGPLTRILALFLIVCCASTGLALGFQGQSDLASGTLYAFQLVYLASIFVVARSMKLQRPDAAVYGWVLAVVSIATYGIVEHFVPIEIMIEGRYRTYERLFFDGQANHIAGFLAMGILVGIVLIRHERWRVLGAVSISLALVALAMTGSREGVVGLAAGLLLMLMINYPKLLIPTSITFFLALLLSPASFWYALSAPGSSMSDRVEAWGIALNSFWSHPLLGQGLAARHRSFYDSQYVLLVSETGLIGLAFFMAWMISLSRALWTRSKGSTLGASLCVAAFASVIAVSVQGLAAVCLLITSIAGPLYWLAGVSLSMSEDSEDA